MIKIKEIPVSERPREKAIRNGIESLSNVELLAIILKSGFKGESALVLAQKLLNKYGSINNLFNTNFESLIRIKGIKSAKATQIIAVAEIIKRLINTQLHSGESIKHPQDIAKYFEPIFRNKPQEQFVVVFLNIKNKVIKYEVLFKGGINFSLIDINLIFKKAIELAASKIICLHNHPSGDTTPSDSDIEISKRIAARGEILEIYLLDHIIIGKEKFTSLKQLSYF